MKNCCCLLLLVFLAAGCGFDLITDPDGINLSPQGSTPSKETIITLADGSRYQLSYVSHQDYLWEYRIETLPKLDGSESKNPSNLQFWLGPCITITAAGGDSVQEVDIRDNWVKFDFKKNFTQGTVWFHTQYIRQGGGKLLAAVKAGQYNNQNPAEIYGPYCHLQGSGGPA